MTMADGGLNFDTNINSEGFEKGLKSLSDMVGDIKPKLKSLAMAVTAAFSVKKLVDFGRQSIETASDLAEVQNVVDTAFGESKQKMEDFADTAVKTYGISKLTAKQTSWQGRQEWGLPMTVQAIWLWLLQGCRRIWRHFITLVRTWQARL